MNTRDSGGKSLQTTLVALTRCLASVETAGSFSASRQVPHLAGIHLRQVGVVLDDLGFGGQEVELRLQASPLLIALGQPQLCPPVLFPGRLPQAPRLRLLDEQGCLVRREEPLPEAGEHTGLEDAAPDRLGVAQVRVPPLRLAQP